VRILDVGGTEVFWQTTGWTADEGIDIAILNIAAPAVHHASFKSIVDDDGNSFFDVAFSNSVIEHVGGYDMSAW
jgi:hypothetical protein